MSNAVSAPGPPVHTKRPDIFLLLLLLVSLSLNVYLGWRIKRAKAAGSPHNVVNLSPGVQVNPVVSVGLDGLERTITYNDTDKPTVFYVLSPSCIWCERNHENILQLAKLKQKDFRFIGLSLAETDLKEYAQSHHLNFPVYTRLSAESIQTLGLGGTPQTIVISPEGKVIRNWSGAYQEQMQREVEEYFQVSLPGLISVKH